MGRDLLAAQRASSVTYGPGVFFVYFFNQRHLLNSRPEDLSASLSVDNVTAYS